MESDHYIQDIDRQYEQDHEKYIKDINLISELILDIQCIIYEKQYWEDMANAPTEWENDFDDLIAWIIKHKKRPSEKSQDETEKFLCRWIFIQKENMMHMWTH